MSPALGAHTAEVLAEWLVDMCAGRLTPAPTTRVQVAPAPSGVAPLAGLRAVDMTWVWAGPFAAMQFAHLGADVVKFESTSRVDVTRRLGPFADGEVDIDRSGYFNQYNQGKRSVVLDVKQPQGLALLKEIVATADLIIDNMRPGSLARMGLDMDTLRTLNPNIVAVAMSGFGEDGPERDRMAYGSIIDALSRVSPRRTARPAVARRTSRCRCPTRRPGSTRPSPRWRRCTGCAAVGLVSGSRWPCSRRRCRRSRGRC